MNIIYILLDQVRKDMLGAYGHQIVKTPNIDRLAKDGVRFNNAFTPASVCGPARTSLFTGLMPSTHGIIPYQKFTALKGITFIVMVIQAVACIKI